MCSAEPRAGLSSQMQPCSGWTPRRFWEANLYSPGVSLAGGEAHGVWPPLFSCQYTQLCSPRLRGVPRCCWMNSAVTFR